MCVCFVLGAVVCPRLVSLVRVAFFARAACILTSTSDDDSYVTIAMLTMTYDHARPSIDRVVVVVLSLFIVVSL